MYEQNDENNTMNILNSNGTTKHKSKFLLERIIPIDCAIHNLVVQHVYQSCVDLKLMNIDLAFEALWPNNKLEPFDQVSWDIFIQNQKFRIILKEQQWLSENIIQTRLCPLPSPTFLKAIKSK